MIQLFIQELNFSEQLLWSVAVISTLLVAVLWVFSLFGLEVESMDGKGKYGDGASILIFFLFLSWSALLAHRWEPMVWKSLLYGLPISLFAAILPIWAHYSSRSRKQKKIRALFEPTQALSSTGQVLSSIPAHKHGRGKVHLNLRMAPYQMEAVTIGGALPPGAPIRVVDIIDDRILVVEPLDGAPPHTLPTEKIRGSG